MDHSRGGRFGGIVDFGRPMARAVFPALDAALAFGRLKLTSRLYDISPSLDARSPVFPGDTPFAAEPTAMIERGAPVNVAKITMTTHAGAHADAPLHYAHGAAAIDEVDLEPYLGPCSLVHLVGAQTITVDALAARLGDRRPQPRILIRTFDAAPVDRWESDYAAVSKDAVSWLADRGVILIGVDTPSLDPETSKTMDAHKAVLAADMRILEGLVLDEPPEGEYELIALPLKLKGLDAAPVRAILRTLG
jgi:arylformamidase